MKTVLGKYGIRFNGSAAISTRLITENEVLEVLLRAEITEHPTIRHIAIRRLEKAHILLRNDSLLSSTKLPFQLLSFRSV